MIRWIADWTAWYQWAREWPWYASWADFRRLAKYLRKRGQPVYYRGWRARWGN